MSGTRVSNNAGFMMQIQFLWLLAFLLLQDQSSGKFQTYVVDPKKDSLCIFWRDERGQPFGTIENLREWLGKRGRKLRFATNGGMFMDDLTPLGLYIENGVQMRPVNRRNGKSNFYIRPQGVFYIVYGGRAFIVNRQRNVYQ
jgi:uncharacterized protein YigE (DUF2233 family)